MQKEEIIKLYNEFETNYDEEAKTSIWKEHSQTFRDFCRYCNIETLPFQDSLQ